MVGSRGGAGTWRVLLVQTALVQCGRRQHLARGWASSTTRLRQPGGRLACGDAATACLAVGGAWAPTWCAFAGRPAGAKCGGSLQLGGSAAQGVSSGAHGAHESCAESVVSSCTVWCGRSSPHLTGAEPILGAPGSERALCGGGKLPTHEVACAAAYEHASGSCGVDRGMALYGHLKGCRKL